MSKFMVVMYFVQYQVVSPHLGHYQGEDSFTVAVPKGLTPALTKHKIILSTPEVHSVSTAPDLRDSPES